MVKENSIQFWFLCREIDYLMCGCVGDFVLLLLKIYQMEKLLTQIEISNSYEKLIVNYDLIHSYLFFF